MFDSWDNPRAQVYRRTYEIPDDLGTAVNVVQMVFGNKGEQLGDRRRASRATRRPASTGVYGEYLVNAQGEDVVAGIRTPQPVEEMGERLPEAYEQLLDTMARLEHALPRHAGHRVHRRGRARSTCCRRAPAKRTAAAALKAAVDMAAEGLISREEAIARIDPAQLDQLLHPMLDPNADFDVAAQRPERVAGRGERRRSCSTPTRRRSAARRASRSSSSAGRRRRTTSTG